MIKKYFQLDDIISIQFTAERETDYRWKERVPERDKKFLGFVVGKHPEIPEGWVSGDFGYLTDDERIRVDSSYLERYSWLRVDEKNKKIWNKATVEINLAHKDMVSRQFNSNEEAQAWIDEIISESGKKFKVIIKD